MYSNRIVLSWRPRVYISGSRTKAFTDRMHGQWVGTYTDEEGGINIRAVFDKYDHDQSNDIDIAELKNVLEDLGVEATDERLHDAFSILDVNDDGVIAYDEFSNWWRKDSVTYTLKRSVEIINTSSSSSAVDAKNVLGSRGRTSMAPPIGSTLLGGGAASAAAAAVKTSPLDNIIQSTNRVVRAVAVPIVTYRGNKTRYEVLGLIPNRLYHFKLRYVGSRSNSALSPPAVLMTAPLPPSPPIIIDVAINSVRMSSGMLVNVETKVVDYRTNTNTSVVTGGRSTSAVKNRLKSAANGTIPTTTGQRYGSN